MRTRILSTTLVIASAWLTTSDQVQAAGEYVAGEAAKGIGQVGLDTGVPVTFGVITADNVEQAIERVGVRSGNRGWDAALNAIEMANLLKGLS